MPFDKLRERMGRAKAQLENLPSREEQLSLENDPSILPNEAMAGYGLRNLLGAASELAPEPVEAMPARPIPGTNLMAPAIALDPTAMGGVMGSIKSAGRAAAELKGAANEANLVKNISKARTPIVEEIEGGLRYNQVKPRGPSVLNQENPKVQNFAKMAEGTDFELSRPENTYVPPTGRPRGTPREDVTLGDFKDRVERANELRRQADLDAALERKKIRMENLRQSIEKARGNLP